MVLDSEPLRIQSLASLSGKNSELAKTGLVVALGVRRTDPDQTKDNTMVTIRQNGSRKSIGQACSSRKGIIVNLTNVGW